MFKSNIYVSAILKGITKRIAIFSLLTSSLFGAGYILPSGTILYDDTPDHTFYRVDKVTPVPSPAAQTSDYTSSQVTNVVIEDHVVTYDRPVVVRERIIDRGPVYDIVDVTGAVIVYGLLYDAAFHSFYHYGPHRGGRPHEHFGRYRH